MSEAALRNPTLPAYMKQEPGKRLKERKAGGLTRKVRSACDLMVWETCGRREAAAKAGITDRTLLDALRKTAVVRYLREQEQVLRDGDRFRNIQRAQQLRDEGKSERVQLEAARFLNGEAMGSSGVQVNVGVQVSPGYVIDLREDNATVSADQAKRRQMLELAANEAKALKDK